MTMCLEDLMVAYSAGDEQACRDLYCVLAPKLRAFFRRSGTSPEIAQDLVQQTFLRLHVARGRYKNGAPVKPWIFMIATNLLTDERRRSSRNAAQAIEEGDEEKIAAPEPDAGISAELAEALQRAIAMLPDNQRQVILLHKYEGMALQDVATVMGCTLSAVKVRAFRAYESIRCSLERGKA